MNYEATEREKALFWHDLWSKAWFYLIQARLAKEDGFYRNISNEELQLIMRRVMRRKVSAGLRREKVDPKFHERMEQARTRINTRLGKKPA